VNLLDKHKALLITALISGTLFMSLFIIDMKNHERQAAESYYELQPEKTPEEKLLEQLALNEKSSQETNKAFNETNDFKDMMKNFKSLNNNDFDKTTKQTETEDEEIPEEVTDVKNSATTQEPSINNDELSSYSKINKVIAMRSAEKRKSTASNGDNSSNKTGTSSSINRNSSVSYSLKDRKDQHLPPPVYLCEENGKIVINISVNSSGAVLNTSVNRASSTSTNECLIDSALEYAGNARFSSAASSNQIGTITYIFVGKN
jgi:outer membrane biosynthesis protein TonB